LSFDFTIEPEDKKGSNTACPFELNSAETGKLLTLKRQKSWHFDQKIAAG